jgi:hypothetical protein
MTTPSEARAIADMLQTDIPAGAVEAFRSLADQVEALTAQLDSYQKRFMLIQGMSRAMSVDIGGNHYWVTQLRDVRGPNFAAALDAAIAKGTA